MSEESTDKQNQNARKHGNNNLIIEEIKKRRARRALSERPVPDDVAVRLSRAAALAPSCFNNQPWRFIRIQTKKALDIVGEHVSKGNYWVKKAPLVFALATKPDLDCRMEGGRDFALFDSGLAAENLVLQATREGLVAHPIAGFDAIGLRRRLGIPKDYILITLIVIGYLGEEASLSEKHRKQEHSESSRLLIESVIFHEYWSATKSEEEGE